MKNWTSRRKESFIFHTTVAVITFGWSAVASVEFWTWIFGSIELALLMLTLVEIISVAGLVLYIRKIESPFIHLRHVLPFLPVIPLSIFTWSVVRQNDKWIAVSVTIFVVSIVVGLLWHCYRTIEKLFIDPLDAVLERANVEAQGYIRRVNGLKGELTALASAFGDEKEVLIVSKSYVNKDISALTIDVNTSVNQDVNAINDSVNDEEPSMNDEIMRMHDIELLSFDKIGLRLGISGTAVYNRYKKVTGGK